MIRNTLIFFLFSERKHPRLIQKVDNYGNIKRERSKTKELFHNKETSSHLAVIKQLKKNDFARNPKKLKTS